jgi:hypothetical protein
LLLVVRLVVLAVLVTLVAEVLVVTELLLGLP